MRGHDITRRLKSAMTGFLLAPVIAALITGQVHAKDDRASLWDLLPGASVRDLPHTFAEHACGTNGGPPSRPLKGFSEFALCPADAEGLHEVYFRYDDEAEYRARALEQSDRIRSLRGTTVYDYPVVASILVRPDGVMVGLRLVTDPRDREIRPRNEFWSLGTILKHRFGLAGWGCRPRPAGAGEEPIGALFINDTCTKRLNGLVISIEQRYFRKRGQTFRNEFGEVRSGDFESSTRFEARLDAAEPSVQ